MLSNRLAVELDEKKIDAIFAEVNQCHLPGAAVGIAIGGQPVYRTRVSEVIGRVSVELYAASDARDTDFTASIIDVHPDGRAVVLGAKVVGIIRARYKQRSCKD